MKKSFTCCTRLSQKRDVAKLCRQIAIPRKNTDHFNHNVVDSEHDCIVGSLISVYVSYVGMLIVIKSLWSYSTFEGFSGNVHVFK